MPGRRPQPTQMKIATGVRKSRISKHEPVMPTVVPIPPDHLSDAARRGWFALCPILKDMGVLTKADGLALERLAECYAEIIDLQEDIRAKGRTQNVITKSGDSMERQRPQVAMLQDADRRFKSYLVEFGLTPAARSKVHGSEAENEDPAAKYLA